MLTLISARYFKFNKIKSGLATKKLRLPNYNTNRFGFCFSTTMATDNTFLYFAYGSNLSKTRIHINNPSAEFYAVAKLKDYRLIFGKQENWVSNRWHGGVASIEPTPGEVVWGVIWKIDSKDMPNLDRQENRYRPISVIVATPEEKQYTCRTYEMEGPVLESLTSPQYKKVITTGATEAGLPAEYMTLLDNVKDNGYDGPVEILTQMDALSNNGEKKH